MTAAPLTSTPTTEPIYTRAQMAARSGIEGEFINRLCELGILSPSGDDRFTPLHAAGRGVRGDALEFAARGWVAQW